MSLLVIGYPTMSRPSYAEDLLPHKDTTKLYRQTENHAFVVTI